MKIKVSEAVGPTLDWLVGYIQTYAATNGKPVLTGDLMQKALQNGMASPSTDWSQGGPIIEREKIELRFMIDSNAWYAQPHDMDSICQRKSGSTPLIAAMRCYVVSNLGDEVEVPEELL